MVVFVLFGGRLADLFGPERTFRLGAIMFVLASVLCGLVQSEAGIIGARGLQGIGAAMLVAAVGVSGGTKGLGRAAALAFAREGARVVVSIAGQTVRARSRVIGVQ